MEKAFKKIMTIQGVKGFVVVNNEGQLTEYAIEMPEAMAAFVLTCGQNCDASGNTRFKYLRFSRNCNEDFFIFPVGNDYLGVLKKEGVGDFTLANTIMDFIDRLQVKSKSTDT